MRYHASAGLALSGQFACSNRHQRFKKNNSLKNVVESSPPRNRIMNRIILYIMSAILSNTLTVKSPAFKNQEWIPSKYTCDGLNVNPELQIGNIPANTKSLAVIVDDPDAPNGTFCHWLLWNIVPKNSISEGSTPGTQGRNSRQEHTYFGPCPPSGTHHYHFKVYALDTQLNLPLDTDEKELVRAMKGHVISWGELVGLYKR